jgi:DNA-binding transcriptional LysR family regulator
MDLALIKTFVEVSDTGSFMAAAERLFVTQSAVSLRVQRLEDLVGQLLFNRSKLGVELTPAGREFSTYAHALLRTWEQALQQVAIPTGFNRVLTVGAEVSLWQSLGFRFVDALRGQLPNLGIRAEFGLPQSLTRSMTDGVMQVSLTYSPSFRPGLSIEVVMEDELILVAPWPDATLVSLQKRYAFVDWGSDFLTFHNRYLPELTNPGLTLSMGSLAARYVIGRGLAAYLPARVAKAYLDRGELHLVHGAETFPHRAWSVWRDDLDPEIATFARKTLFDVAAIAVSETLDITHQI